MTRPSRIPPEWEVLWRLGGVSLQASYSLKLVRVPGTETPPMTVVGWLRFDMDGPRLSATLDCGVLELWGDAADEAYQDCRAADIPLARIADSITPGILSRIVDAEGRTVTSTVTEPIAR